MVSKRDCPRHGCFLVIDGFDNARREETEKLIKELEDSLTVGNYFETMNIIKELKTKLMEYE